MNTKNRFFDDGKDLDEKPGFLLWQAYSLWKQAQKHVLEQRFHLTQNQYILLTSIYWKEIELKEEVSQAELARYTKIEPMTASQTLKQLEENGFVIRDQHPDDIRAKTVSMTQKGIDIVKVATKAVSILDSRFFADVKNSKSWTASMKNIISSNDIF